MSKQKSAILCNHANETPAKCTCQEDCYCKSNTCRKKSLFELIGCLKGGECDWVTIDTHNWKCSRCAATKHQFTKKELAYHRKLDREFARWFKAKQKAEKEALEWLDKHPMIFKSSIQTAPMLAKTKKELVAKCVNHTNTNGNINLKSKLEKRKRTK